MPRRKREKLCLHAGHVTGCRECRLAGKRASAKKAYDQNPQFFCDKTKTWHAAHPGVKSQYAHEYYEKNAEAICAKVKQAYAEDPEAVKRRVAQWQADNPDRVRAWRRFWKHNNPESIRVHGQRRRVRLLAVGGEISKSDWLQVLAQFTVCGEVCCAYCSKPCEPTMDHVVPISRGGRHEPDNVLPACAICNASKGARLIHEWKRAPALLAPEVLALLVEHTEQHLASRA
jgi:5-methylcytosine-specific restriction endonuclease McrA